MKNTFKRIVSLATSVLLWVSVLTACGESVALLPFIDTEADGIDLSGFVCKIAQSDHSDNTGVVIDENNPFGYKENTEFADAVLGRIADIENELKCEIQLSTISADGRELYYMVLADNVSQEVFYSPSHGIMKTLSKGYFLENVGNYGEYIDLTNTDKYGAANIQEMNAFNGNIYAVSPMAWMLKQPRALELIVLNEDLRSKYNTPDPKEYIENGTWNWDSFEEFIAQSSYESDDVTVYSMAARSFDIVKLLAYGNGFRLAYDDGNGGYGTDYGQSNMVEAAQFYYDLVQKYPDSFVYKRAVDWPDIKEAFVIAQNSVACLTSSQVLFNDIIYAVKNYSVVPFPTGPQGEYGKWPSAIESTDSFSVFVTADNPEIDFKIIGMLCEPFEGYSTEEERLNYLATNVLYTEEDAQYVSSIYKNGFYTQMTYYFESIGFDNLWREFETGGKSPKAVSVIISEYSQVYLELIEEFVVPNMVVYDMIPN